MAVKSTGTGITDGSDCDLPFGFRESNLGSLQGQQVLLSAEPSLQPCLILKIQVMMAVSE